MPHVLIVEDATRPWSGRTARAFAACFGHRLGWSVSVTGEARPPQRDWTLVAGWGWGTDQMAAARRIAGDRFLHVDSSLFGPVGWGTYFKVALGPRWTPLTGGDFPSHRLRRAGVEVAPARKPGKRVLLCGMSVKAVDDWGEPAARWERDALLRLRAAGAEVIYRPKPNRPGVRELPPVAMDPNRDQALVVALQRVHAVVTHHSNAAIEAIAAGLPVYSELGPARGMSVGRIEDVVGAAARDRDERQRFLAEIAWHQWTLAELARGDWLKPPAPLAGLAA